MEAGFKNVTMPEDSEATFQTVRQMMISGQKTSVWKRSPFIPAGTSWWECCIWALRLSITS